MGIKIRANSTASSGLKLVFKEGITYDLDQIISSRNRSDGSSRLLIQVKYDKDVSREVMNKLKNDVNLAINSTLDNVDVQNGINEIIIAYPTDYVAKINQYLKSLLTEYDLSFYAVQYPGTEYIEITYDFDNDAELTRRFQDYYSKYGKTYREILNNGLSEGSLAISDIQDQVPTDASDYAKYLLGKDIKKEISVHDLEMLYKKINEMQEEVNRIKIAYSVQNTDAEVPTSKAVIDYTNSRLNTITNVSDVRDDALYLSNLDDVDDDVLVISDLQSLRYDKDIDGYVLYMEV